MASSTLWVNTVLVLAFGSFCSHHLAANAVIERDFTTESPCRGDSVFHCDDVNVECVPINQTCNGVSECSSGRDESVEVCGCLPNEFQCNKTTCIDMIKRCDTFADCDDGEDEKRCETYFCPETHEKCSNNLCIPKSSRCNFVDDCGDNSDEVKCSHRKCHSTEFRCNNSQCVPNSLLCDERDDCLDGSDEVDCSSHVKCINSLYVHKDRVCDGWIDCFDDHADEINCGNCTGNQFRCNNGRCIKDANKCDGVCDCVGDCGDEASCNSLSCPLGSFYLCRRSHRCISRKYVCDGHNDCQNSQDGADEYFCWNKTDKCRGFSNSKHAHFVCPEGRCIPATSRCDYYADCLWGEDEFNCTYPPCSADEFRCDNGQCVAWTRRCNGGSSPDCYDRSDEVGCENHSCPFGHRKCLGGQCLPEGKWCDFWRDCPDNSDEMDCIRPSCTADEFLCNNGQCVSKHMECYKGLNTERLGCADGSHLFYCREWKCKPGQFKCRNSYCIDDSQVCNDNLDCSMTYTDELSCEFKCPASTRECVCKEVKMNCGDRNLTTVPNPEDSIQLDMSGNYINYSISEKTFQNYDMLTELDISRNSLTFLPRGCFRNLWRLSTLNLAFNNLTQIRNETFTGLTSLRSMFLHGNRIKTVDPYAFKGLSDLLTLDLSGQQINHIAQDAFNGLRNVRVLNLSRNNIEGIDDGAFNGLHQLLTLDISHNRLRTIGKNAFHGLPQLQTLYTDEFRFCCLVKEVSDCYPKPDEFSSCEDLMSNYVLRINIWILGMVASFGNLLVIGWRARDLKSGKVHSFLITNLALGDFFMGVYLLIIAVADSYYRGVYSIHDKFWRESVLCKFAGFMSTFSSELSVFTLTVITLDRLICIIFPFRMRRMGLREARLVMLCLWLAVSVMASLPLVGIHYFDTFYSRSGVCLAFHITPDRPRGWEYSVALFMAVNFFSFFIIFASYLWMFIVAKQTRCAVRDAEAKTDNAMAKRMTMIVLTDFACWVPIILLGCASLGGARIPPEVYAWVAVFILPVNSAINPVLYTISTAPFLGHVRKRATKFRKSFMSSMSVDTKHSFMEDGTSNYWERTKSHYRQLELIRMRPLTKSSASQTVARNGCQPTREDKYGDTQCMMADLFKNDDLDSGQSHAEINSTEEFV